jgi:hypothetical protein
MGTGLAGNTLAKQSGGRAMAFQGNLIGPVLSGAIFSILWALMVSVITAIPTKYFADHTIDTRVVVDKVSGFRISYGNYIWVHYKQGDSNGKFMWTRAKLAEPMKSGDCINLRGRKWSFGFYVDSISKSSGCAE